MNSFSQKTTYLKIKPLIEIMKPIADNWPVLSGNYEVGNPSSNVAICTITTKLSFPKELCAMSGEMKTENLGIERVIVNTVSNANIRYIVVCGKESKGHFAGQTLISIHENGIDDKGRIIGSKGAIPFIENISKEAVERFRRQIIKIVDLIGETDREKVIEAAKALPKEKPFEEGYFTVKEIENIKKEVVKAEEGEISVAAKETGELQIGNVKIGGNNPIVLIGTIFYGEEKNREDLTEAKRKMEEAIQLSQQYKIPFIPDVYLTKGDDIQKIIDFISSFSIPFCIDSSEWDVRTAALKYCKEKGIDDRAIYNSINCGMSEEEREQVKELRPKNAIVLAFNPLDNSVQGKLNYMKSKLIPFSKYSAKVQNILVDSGVMPLGNGSLNSIKAVNALKNEFNFPTGNGIHNLASEKIKDYDKELKKIIDSSLVASQALLGADFLLFGPIESAKRIFPVVKLIEDILKDG